MKTEVHPNFSEAPHLRGSIPHPKTDFSKNQIAPPMNNPMAQLYKNVIFRNKIGIPTIFPVFKKRFSGDVLPLQ